MTSSTSTWKLANKHWHDKAGDWFTSTVTLTFVEGRDKALLIFATWDALKPSDPTKAHCMMIDAKTTSAAEISRIAREGLQAIMNGEIPVGVVHQVQMAG